MPPKVSFHQSEANNPDAQVLESLLADMSRLRVLRGRARIGGGFSQCRVYIMLAEYSSAAPQPWIVKVGPAAEIRAEAEAYPLGASHIKPPNLVPKLEVRSDDDHGVLIFSYAGFSGRPPRDLSALLSRPEALEALLATVEMIEGWTASSTWRNSNVLHTLKQWLLPKLEKLPPAIAASTSCKCINSPDFGEVYSNPAYFLTHDARGVNLSCPFGFTHGDLNLRNVLFNLTEGSVPDTSTPLVIDLRHATDDQYAIVDLAKLEACLRYEHVSRVETVDDMQQVTSFLDASRRSLLLGSAPDVLTSKRLQELWRGVGHIRAAVARVFEKHRESEPCYWATLAAYGVSASTYETVSFTGRHLAYLDAAALITRYLVPRDPTATQHIVVVHETLSPPVQTAPPPPEEFRNLPLLLAAVREVRCLLVVGTWFGKTVGIEPLLPFLQRLHKDVTGDAATATSAPVLGELLTRKATRQRILHAIRQRTSNWGEPVEGNELGSIRSAAVFSVHYHDKAVAALRTSSVVSMTRIDTVDDAVRAFDDIVRGTTPYLPVNGDIDSSPDSIVLTRADRSHRSEVTRKVAQALSRRNVPLAITFWRCEEMSADELLLLRDELVEDLTVPYDLFYVTDVDDTMRDGELRDIGIWRVKRTLRELAKLAGDPSPLPSHGGATWDDGNTVFTVPDVSRLSRDLVLRYGEIGNVSGHIVLDDVGGFLLGSPATEEDIIGQRVAKRILIERDLIPAVRTELKAHSNRVRLIFVSGRAGAGVSSILCHTAHILEKERLAPVFVVARSAARGGDEWRNAVSLLKETSTATSRSVIVIFDAHDGTRRDLEYLVDCAVELNADIVAIVGGRADTIDILREHLRPTDYQDIRVSDALTRDECGALARILQHNGYCTGKRLEDLAQQLGNAQYLLPAIYEATDKANRKFTDIVLHEYRRYDREQLVQRAYRLICIMTWFGQRLSQYWLLKALGPYGRADAVHILGRLSDDIVTESAGTAARSEKGEVWIAARHSIIAEEVLNVAVPEPHHRFVDIRDIIASANTGSEIEGTIVSSLLSHKGILSRWVRKEFKDSRPEQLRRLTEIYEAALASGHAHPRVARDLRQHFALMLRRFDKLDEALDQAKTAAQLDQGNAATAHILGLIHERRAVKAWSEWARAGGENADELRIAQRNEQDAIDFFRESRSLHPHYEHGYESEARYYLRKHGAVARMSGKGAAGVKERAAEQVIGGLWLLETAEALLPRSRLIEAPKTKAHLLATVGDHDRALERLKSEIRSAQDPLRIVQLRRALATIAIVGKRYDEAIDVLGQLIDSGDHLAENFILLDDAMRATLAPLSDREARFRESAEDWNRLDVETLVRWAEIRLYRSDWEGAIRTLRRADDAARMTLSGFAREESRGVLCSSITSTEPRRFTGTVVRLWKPYEGLVSFRGLSDGIYFTTDRGFGGTQIGEEITYCLAWRLRGLRAVRLSRVGDGKPDTR